MERHLVRKLLSALDMSRSLSQNTVASLNSYRSHVQVKLTRFVRSVDRISALCTAGGATKNTPELQIDLSFVLSVRGV